MTGLAAIETILLLIFIGHFNGANVIHTAITSEMNYERNI